MNLQIPSVLFAELGQALGAAWAQLSDAENDEFKQQRAETSDSGFTKRALTAGSSALV